MKGRYKDLIKVESMRGIKADNSERWAIVRSMTRKAPGVRQVADLSPSSALFHKYLDLKKSGAWNGESFKNIYVPAFLQQMREPKARSLLNTLWKRDKAGENITLLCFCADEALCHRSIVAGLLQGAGCDVITETGADYTRYYDMYRRCLTT